MVVPYPVLEVCNVPDVVAVSVVRLAPTSAPVAPVNVGAAAIVIAFPAASLTTYLMPPRALTGLAAVAPFRKILLLLAVSTVMLAISPAHFNVLVAITAPFSEIVTVVEPAVLAVG